MIFPEKRTVLTHFTWKAYGGLEPRQTYEVVRPFTDFDGHELPVGWKGRYRAYNYFPYDDGLSLAFDTGDGLCIVRLRLRPGSQDSVGRDLLAHFRLVDDTAMS